jgi:hypothetical protein
MSIRRRRLLPLAVLGAVIVLAIGVWLVWPQPSAITGENVAKIKVGMTLAEVEAILGGPARDETNGSTAATYIHISNVARPDPYNEKEWRSDDVAVIVEFHDGRVILCNPAREFARRSWPDRLCRWLGL